MAVTVVDSEKLAMVLTQRIQRRLDRLGTKNPDVRAALLRIGQLIEGEAKLNIRRAGLIDTGRLINSIRHFVFIRGDIAELSVGSFATPYAAVHEFGFNGSVSVSAHTRRTRSGTDARVRAHNRRMSIQGQHYLERAAQKQAGRITGILQDMFRSA